MAVLPPLDPPECDVLSVAVIKQSVVIVIVVVVVVVDVLTEHFSGPESLVVPPSSTRNYELTYQPLTMTTDGKKHAVRYALSVVFP